MEKSSKFESKNCMCVQFSHLENIQMTQIWFCGKIGVISWYRQRIFWKFWFFGDFWHFKGRNLTIFVIFDQNLLLKLPKITKKSKFSKYPLSVPRYYPNLATKPNLGHLEHPLSRKLHANISKSHFFGRFFIEICEIARVVVNFETSLHNNEKIFFNSVKSSWTCITQIAKYV